MKIKKIYLTFFKCRNFLKIPISINVNTNKDVFDSQQNLLKSHTKYSLHIVLYYAYLLSYDSVLIM